MVSFGHVIIGSIVSKNCKEKIQELTLLDKSLTVSKMDVSLFIGEPIEIVCVKLNVVSQLSDTTDK